MSKRLSGAQRGVRGILSALLTPVIVAGLLFAGATQASAASGGTKSLPSFHGTGTVTMNPNSWSGTARWDYSDGSYCVYIQYKHVARFGVDGTWNRLTSNSCSSPVSAAWSKGTDRPFNGMKFRLCQDKPNSLDSCGNDVTIYL